VEAIAKQSQNRQWDVSVDGQKHGYRLIRRVSLDRFYQIVTGDPKAFYKICFALPDTIDYVMINMPDVQTPNDTVMEELLEIADRNNLSIATALYYLGFLEYIGLTRNYSTSRHK